MHPYVMLYTYVYFIDKDNFLIYFIHIELISFCKTSGILCLKFNLFDHFRNTLPHLFVISHVDISLLSLIHFSQWSPVYCHLFIFVYLIDGQILDWRVFKFIIVIPSCILFWEFMSLSVPQIFGFILELFHWSFIEKGEELSKMRHAGLIIIRHSHFGFLFKMMFL